MRKTELSALRADFFDRINKTYMISLLSCLPTGRSHILIIPYIPSKKGNSYAFKLLNILSEKEFPLNLE